MPSSTAETLLINKIFGAALEKKATDIHLMAGNYPIFRVGSELQMLSEGNVLTVDLLSAVVDSILSESEKKKLENEKEVKTIYVWANRARFRSTVFYQKGYPSISFRLVPNEIPDPKKLLIPDVIIERSLRRQGLIIVCGPYNSGRTMTMMSLLQNINATTSKRILTIEHPAEFVFINSKSIISQRQVGVDTPSFTQGIKDAIDEDVDIVAIGAIPEIGMHELLLTLVESGKLVIAVANATSTISALEKFIMSISEDKRLWAKDSLATLLLAVINQRLVPKVGGGQLLAAGILTMTPAVASIIQDEHFPQLATVMQTSREEGMVTLDVRLQELVRGGKISSHDARRFANDPSIIR